MLKAEITPGSMGAVAVAIDLFGCGMVEPGNWPGPVWITHLSEEEFNTAKEIFEGWLGLNFRKV